MRIDALLARLPMPALTRVELSVLRPVATPPAQAVDDTRLMLAEAFSELGRKGVLVVRDFRGARSGIEWEASS